MMQIWNNLWKTCNFKEKEKIKPPHQYGQFLRDSCFLFVCLYGGEGGRCTCWGLKANVLDGLRIWSVTLDSDLGDLAWKKKLNSYVKVDGLLGLAILVTLTLQTLHFQRLKSISLSLAFPQNQEIWKLLESSVSW